MRILIIRPMAIEININSYNCQELGLAKGFVDSGHECDVLFFSNEEKKIEVKYKDKIINIFYKTGKIKYKINGIFDNLDSLVSNYDLVQMNEITQLQTINSLTNSKYKNKIYVYHGPYKNSHDSFKHKLFNIVFESKIKRLFKRESLKNIVFTKSNLASDYLETLGINSQVIGVGLDLTNLTNYTSGNYNPFELLYVGKLEERRNILFIVEVLKKLIDIDERYHLTIIGKGEKKYTSKIDNKIKELDLDDKITIIDRVNQKQLIDYYIGSGIFLLPTNYEIFGMVILESLYYGLPVITTLNGGSSVLKKGVYINNIDVNEWVNTIYKISSNYGIIQHDELKKYIVNNFVWNVLAKQIIQKMNIKAVFGGVDKWKHLKK